VLLRNEGFDSNGVPRFANVAMAVGADDIRDGRGAAFGDIDNDGDLDIVMNTNPGDHGIEKVPPMLLRNDIGNNRNWLAVELIGSRSNRDAIGAEVSIHCEGLGSAKPFHAMRHVTVGSGYASQNDHRIQFGLGEAHRRVTSLSVRWPGSTSWETFENIPANRWARIREGVGLELFDPRFPAGSGRNVTSTAALRKNP
jgi:enediyne biosynthesis protein E4